MTAVRLDVVVAVKEREERKRLRLFSQAQQAALRSNDELLRAKAKASADGRSVGDASEFWLDDLAHRRALDQVRQAESRAVEAGAAMARSRSEWTTAKNRTEAVRRVADAKREEIRFDEARKELRELDELALRTTKR